MTIYGMRPTIASIAIFASSSLAAYAQTPTPAAEPGLVRVFDANGKQVGNTVGVEKTRVTVALTAGGYVFVLRAFQDHFEFEGPGTIFFESLDCSGTLFISAQGDPTVLQLVALAPPGNTVYVPSPGAAPRSITANSALYVSGCTTQLPGGQTVDGAFPAVALMDLNSQFTPPFRVIPSSSLAQTCGDCNGDGTVKANEITQVISNVFGDAVGSAP